MKRTTTISLLMAALTPSACGDDGNNGNNDTEGSSSGDGSSSGGMPTTEADPTGLDSTTGPAPDSSSEGGSSSDGDASSSDGGSSSSGGPTVGPVEFFVLIENISNTGPATTDISPGVWADHAADVQGLFFIEYEPEPGQGLELLAEDGDPTTLAASITDRGLAAQSGVFDTPRGGGDPGPIAPGDSYMFTFTAEPFTRLSMMMKLDESNDIAMGASEAGIGLFIGNGQPYGTRDVTGTLALWDAGSEANQALGQGPNQAPYADVDVGPPESGVVSSFASSTRAIPQAAALVEVEVDQGDGVKVPAEQFTITLTNVSGQFGTLVTPLSGLLWAMHDDTASLFVAGSPDPGLGLEALAEDGEATPLAEALDGTPGFESTGTVAGPALPGDTLVFQVTAVPTAPQLSFATMIGESNDAFLAMGSAGVSLFDDQGVVRDDEAVEGDIRRVLGAWDAGTEANQVPGVGPDQAPRQLAANTGAADANPNVRRYRDITNDLAGEDAGGFLSVEVVAAGGGSFDVTITNTSGNTAFPGQVSRVLWAVHDPSFAMFAAEYAAEPGLESLAEDGDPAQMLADLEIMPGVLAMDVVEIPDGAGAPAPLAPGDSYTFTVTPNDSARYLNFVAKLGPSNDAFAALGAEGIELVDDGGVPMPPAVIAAAIADQLRAWDAGTENNQAGAAGAQMGPGGAVNTGPSEGNGLVRDSADDPVWPTPDVTTILRVTVGPTER